MHDATISILIIVKDRIDHLLSTIAGIERADVVNPEIVVVHINEDMYDISSPLTIKQIRLDSKEKLPLAAARNMAAKTAANQQLCFLDVDCIPARTFFGDIAKDGADASITMADPRYLKNQVNRIDDESLENDSAPNPARKGIRFGVSQEYELFWSLGFAVTKATFDRIGGFDESFVGYGGEDTDFAYMAKEKGIPLYLSKARVYHQPHPEYDPPLNWFEDIVTNSRAFYKKWHTWPMTGWLHAFEDRGLLRLNNDSIDILRTPTEQEINRAAR